MDNQKKEKNYGFWNWGTGIAITIVIGALATLFLVYKTTTIDFEMAEEDYYAQELKYNSKLEAIANARQLSKPIAITQDPEFLKITVPKECFEADSGNIKLYRPSSQKHDLKLAFEPDSNGNLLVAKSELITGIYRMKASWFADGKSFYVEQSFYVEKDR